MDNDLISRETLIQNLKSRKMAEFFPNWQNGMSVAAKCAVLKYANVIRRIICDVPAVDAAMMQHGRWLPPMVGKYGCVCSVCIAQADNDFDYCPNFGAKMGTVVEV